MITPEERAELHALASNIRDDRLRGLLFKSLATLDSLATSEKKEATSELATSEKKEATSEHHDKKRDEHHDKKRDR